MRTLICTVCLFVNWTVILAEPPLNEDLRDAVKQIPWNELSPAAQNTVRRVVAGAPLFRHLPQQTAAADSEINSYLLRHPDIVIGLWERFGVTQLSLREVKENQYIFKEQSGTTAVIDILYRTEAICIVYAKGEYRGPLLAKIHQGEAVVVLRTKLKPNAAEPVIVYDLDVFLQINSLGAELLAKLFYSSLGKTADGNFEVTVSFVSQLSKAASRDPENVKQTVDEIGTVRRDVRSEFCEVLDRASARYAKRRNAAVEPVLSDSTGGSTSGSVFDTDPFFSQPFKQRRTKMGEFVQPKRGAESAE